MLTSSSESLNNEYRNFSSIFTLLVLYHYYYYTTILLLVTGHYPGYMHSSFSGKLEIEKNYISFAISLYTLEM